MQITQIMHASILIESGGLRILSDPWWRGPCFGAQWWTYGDPFLKPLEGKIDYIYISHGHHDHYHPGTLKTLDREAKVLVSAHLDIAESIRGDGFEVIEVQRDREHDLGNDVRIRIMDTHGDDTLMVVSDGEQVCLNLNDALHSAPRAIQDRFIAILKALYGQVDYLFCGYGIASHFPNCYRIPGKDDERTAIARQKYFNRQWAYLVAQMEPRFGFPFAADVILYEDELRWANEPVHNGERPTDAFAADYPDAATQVCDIAPGFRIADGVVRDKVLRTPLNMDELAATHAEEAIRANRYPSVSDEQVDGIVAALQKNIAGSLGHFAGYPGDYRLVIAMRNYSGAVEIVKRGATIDVRRVANRDAALTDCDVSLTTRQSYLNWSLTRPYGHEIILVGSGGIFEFRDAAKVSAGFHHELRQMITLQTEALPPRPTSPPAWLRRLKTMVKTLLGRQQVDLYSLGDWTVFRR